MKANEAPEKVYLLFNRPYLIDYTKLNKRRCEEEVEYSRTDAFIEKACEYLIEYEFNDSPTIADRRKRVEEFKKYMKE